MCWLVGLDTGRVMGLSGVQPLLLGGEDQVGTPDGEWLRESRQATRREDTDMGPWGGYSQLLGGEREDRCTDTADQWKPSNSDDFTVSRLLRKSTKDAEFGFRVNNVPPTPGP